MQAGKLRQRIEIQTDGNTTADTFGQIVPDFATVDTVWASVEPLRGRELLQAQEVQAGVSHRVRMRHRTLAPTQRLRLGTRVFEIVSILNRDERDAQLEVMCNEKL